MERKTYHINDSVGIKLLTRLRLSFRYLGEPKFRQNIKGTLNLLCTCSIEAETAAYFFLRCHFCNGNGAILINDLENIGQSLPTLCDVHLSGFTMAMKSLMTNKIYAVLMFPIKFLQHSQRFAAKL